MMTPQEIIDVVTAFANGKEIECRRQNKSEMWFPVLDPEWNFEVYEYRVKPKPRRFWLNLYPT